MRSNLVNAFTALILLACTHVAAAQETVHLHLVASEVEAVAMPDHGAIIKLKPASAARLKTITRNHIGKSLEVTIDGIPAMTAVIHAEMDSGLVRISDPTPEWRKRFEEMAKSSTTK